MGDRGIIFSAPMVRALLAGRKTQTRRLLRNPEYFGCPTGDCPHQTQAECNAAMGALTVSDTRYAPGDRLYVREAHYLTDDGHNERAVYAADGAEDHITAIKDFRHKAGLSAEWEKRHTRLRPSIHMPRWASRLTLTVTEVRVERLQDISEADAVAEGCVWDSADGFDVWYVPGAQMPRHGATAIECYSLLWNTLHTDPGARWEDNPWVVAISFDVRNGNIDTEASNAQ